METLCTLIKPYKCPNCNKDTLFFYTSNNTLIDYKMLFCNEKMSSYEIKKFLEYKKVRFLKCIACNKLYIIDWRDGFPIPLTDKSCLTDFGF